MPTLASALRAARTAVQDYELAVLSRKPKRTPEVRFNDSLTARNVATVRLTDSCDQLGRILAHGVAESTRRKFWIGSDKVCYKTFGVRLQTGRSANILIAAFGERDEDGEAIWTQLSYIRQPVRIFIDQTAAKPTPKQLCRFVGQFDAVLESLEQSGCWPPPELPTKQQMPPRVTVSYTEEEYRMLQTASFFEYKSSAWRTQKKILESVAEQWSRETRGFVPKSPPLIRQPHLLSAPFKRIGCALSMDDFLKFGAAALEAGYPFEQRNLFARDAVLGYIDLNYGSDPDFLSALAAVDKRKIVQAFSTPIRPV